MAEGIFRREVAKVGLQDRIRIDSAGTHSYHIGEPPDTRAQSAISWRGWTFRLARPLGWRMPISRSLIHPGHG